MADSADGRRRILVAEDEPHIRRILTTMLESADFAVIAMPDGRAAIEEIESDGRVDLVVTDLMMPRATGLDILERVQALPHRNGTPVLVLTAKGQDADRDAAFGLGARDFLTKPFSPKKLLARIDEILQD